ncbi:MFS transporter [Paenibacillus marinisediminis]
MQFAHNLMTEIKGWNRNIQLFFISNILYQFGSGLFSVLYNLYIKSLGYDQVMNGSIVSIQSLATALLFIPIGLLGDRLSRKPFLVTGALFTGILFISRAFAQGEPYLQLLAIGTGVFASFYQVLAVPFLAENSGIERRLRMFSLHFSMVLASQVLGNISGGIIADSLQAIGIDHTQSLQTALLFGGIATLFSFIPLLFVKEKKAESVLEASVSTVAEKSIHTADNARDDWRNIGKFTIGQLLIGFGSGLVIPYLNLYFTDRFDISLTSVGLLVSLGQVMTIISMMIGPKLVGRVGQVRAIVYFQLLSLPFLLLTGFTNILLIASISFLFRQALMNAANPIQSNLMVDRVSDRRRGIANSITQTAFMLGWASMGSVQSALITNYGTYWGYAITFSITGILYVTAALCFFLMFREPHPSKLHLSDHKTASM